MRNLKISGVVVAATLLVTPAAVLAAGSVHPANGKFTGEPQYKDFRGKSEVGKLTVTVARHRITGVSLLTPTPPVTANSSGLACDAITAFVSKGHHVEGSMSRNGSFGYRFTESFKYDGKVTNTDTITLEGRFTGAKRAAGTFRDVSSYTAAS
ncbi:MAG: hypothetical protein ACYCXW_15010, partial [Solirubrobacteraceae bacterium]